MCKKQEDFIHILEEIGEVEIKTSAKKAVDIAKPVELLIRQYRDLNKNEREKLLEGCRMMYEDSAGAANQCQTVTALIVSVIAAIISAASLSVTVAENASEIVQNIATGTLLNNAVSISPVIVAVVSMAASIFTVLAAYMAVDTLLRIRKRLKIADRYRNACLALIALSDYDNDGEAEE